MRNKAAPSNGDHKPVGIWIRVSTEDQVRGESPEVHEKRARMYAEARGWKTREVYRLEAVSGKAVIAHPEAQRMLADIRSGHITGLVFSKLARLARNAAPKKRVVGVARFSEAGLQERLTSCGVETIACDLLDRAAVAALPQIRNVIFMAGRKFGAQTDPALVTFALELSPVTTASFAPSVPPLAVTV